MNLKVTRIGTVVEDTLAGPPSPSTNLEHAIIFVSTVPKIFA